MIPVTTLAPGAVIGILGGGQLGRMTALAAARLGFRCHVFAAEADSPAGQVCGAATVAEFLDREALERFASAVDIATFEFENIPAEAVRCVSAVRPVLPRPEILEIAQDRLREKDFLRSIDVDTASYSFVRAELSLILYALVPILYILPGRIDIHWGSHRRDKPIDQDEIK